MALCLVGGFTVDIVKHHDLHLFGFASACYQTTLPTIAASTQNRTIAWGSPSMITSINGRPWKRCENLDQVRDTLDTIDAQLLQLLSTR